jgi:hypothetical protein
MAACSKRRIGDSSKLYKAALGTKPYLLSSAVAKIGRAGLQKLSFAKLEDQINSKNST